jgi:hypothetical protein
MKYAVALFVLAGCTTGYGDCDNTVSFMLNRLSPEYRRCEIPKCREAVLETYDRKVAHCRQIVQSAEAKDE